MQQVISTFGKAYASVLSHTGESEGTLSSSQCASLNASIKLNLEVILRHQASIEFQDEVWSPRFIMIVP